MSHLEVTFDASLLHMRQMCRQDGSSLPLGQQLCRVLQLEVLPVVLGVCVFGVWTCTGVNRELRVPVYLAVVCNVLASRASCNNDCQHFPSTFVRHICLCNVLRSIGGDSERNEHNRSIIVEKRFRTCHKEITAIRLVKYQKNLWLRAQLILAVAIRGATLHRLRRRV